MASLAGGRVTGVAPNADLFLVKTKAQFRRGAGDGMSNGPITYSAMSFFLNGIMEHIDGKLKKNPNAKSVINLSGGRSSFVTRSVQKTYNFRYRCFISIRGS